MDDGQIWEGSADDYEVCGTPLQSSRQHLGHGQEESAHQRLPVQEVDWDHTCDGTKKRARGHAAKHVAPIQTAQVPFVPLMERSDASQLRKTMAQEGMAAASSRVVSPSFPQGCPLAPQCQ